MLYTTNIGDYNALIKYINEAGVEYHTYTPKTEVEPRMVLKNMPPNVTVDEIINDLTIKKLNVKSVKQMIKKTDGGDVKMPLFIVVFEKSTKTSDIVKHNKVCHCIIQWEKFKSTSGVTQCYNCQNFGHIAKNCHRQVKCLKCANNHSSKDCPNLASNVAKCSNCGGGHTASDKTCEVYSKILQNQRHTSIRTNSNSHGFNSSSRDFPPLTGHRPVNQTSGTSTWPATPASHTAKPSSSSSNATPTESIGDFFKEIKSIFSSINIAQLLIKFKTIGSKLKSAPDAVSKLAIVIESVVDLFD